MITFDYLDEKCISVLQSTRKWYKLNWQEKLNMSKLLQIQLRRLWTGEDE